MSKMTTFPLSRRGSVVSSDALFKFGRYVTVRAFRLNSFGRGSKPCFAGEICVLLGSVTLGTL